MAHSLWVMKVPQEGFEKLHFDFQFILRLLKSANLSKSACTILRLITLWAGIILKKKDARPELSKSHFFNKLSLPPLKCLSQQSFRRWAYYLLSDQIVFFFYARIQLLSGRHVVNNEARDVTKVHFCWLVNYCFKIKIIIIIMLAFLFLNLTPALSESDIVYVVSMAVLCSWTTVIYFNFIICWLMEIGLR